MLPCCKGEAGELLGRRVTERSCEQAAAGALWEGHTEQPLPSTFRTLAHLEALMAQALLWLPVVEVQQAAHSIKAQQQAPRILLAIHCKVQGREIDRHS